MWQFAHRALPLNKPKPRFAADPIAASSPEIQRSKGVSPEMIVRSNVAIASSMLCRLIAPSGNAAANAATYPGIAERRAARSSAGSFMLADAVIGAKVTLSRELNLPSQQRLSPQAMFSSVGVRRARGCLPTPCPRGSPSLQESPGLWQVAHEIVRGPESRGSKKSMRPKAALGAEYELSSGKGIES